MNNVRPVKQFLPLKWYSVFILGVISLAFWLSSAHPISAQRQDYTFPLNHEVQLASPLVIDLNGDGKLEMIFGSIDGFLTVVNGAPPYAILWERNVADFMPGFDHTRIMTHMAAADLNNDGAVEIVVSTGGDPVNKDGPGAVIVFTLTDSDPVTLELMPGNWPRFAKDELGNGNRPDGYPDGFTASPALGDIDGDGDLEIVIGGMDRRIHAFQYDGNYVPGWPLDNTYLYGPLRRDTRSTAALADLDNDGVQEIVIGTNNYKIPNCANPYYFYVVNGDTTPLPGFPFETTQNVESSPVIGDINGDGSLDIVFGTGDGNESCREPGGQQSDGKKVYAISSTGQLLPGWPVRTNANMVNSPALGDLDNDGKPEVVIHTNDTLYAWHGDGTLLPGFPVTGGDFHLRHHAPVLADVDGDGQVEIVLASGQVFGPNGQRDHEDRNKLRSPIVVVDQDGDGLLETIGANHFNENIGLHLKVYIFEETGPATGAMPWPTFHRTIDRAGLLPLLYVLSGRVIDEDGDGVEGVTVKLDSGENVETDDDGHYVFLDVPAGEYVMTADNGKDFVFEPEEQAISLHSNVTAEDFVMHDLLFDINGQVRQANQQPLKGVSVRLNNGDVYTTGNDGRFFFTDLKPGEYTITPLAPELNYMPGRISAVITLEDQFVTFYALPAPISKTINPDGPTEIAFDDVQGLGTKITFPEGLEEGEVVVTPKLQTSADGFLMAGHTMELALSQQELPSAITIEIAYSDEDLQKKLESDKLVVLWQSPSGWVDAESTCSKGEDSVNDEENQVITASVCELGTYALAGPHGQLNLPQLFGPRP